jgi:small subunit ribosomal protein S4
VSDRGLQLREKQRARAIYGVLEKQFRRYYAEAVRRPGVSGDNLLRLLELRLDNLLFRLGFADSRAQGRQVVLHGHITVNGRKAHTPSHVLKVGDVIGWTSRGQNSQYFQIVKEQLASKSPPSWLSVEEEKMIGRVLMQPEIEEIGAKFSSATVVEYYSR